jgi:endonuclease G
MTPQLNEHNEGIWAALESKVRTIANGSDTTYVVTGVVVSPASRKTRDSYGNDMTIPDAYYKALLYYNSHSTLGQWNAVGFYIEHKEYSGGVKKEYSMSIDELEEKTGLDFFVNLPAKVGAFQADAIEAADPTNVSLWW